MKATKAKDEFSLLKSLPLPPISVSTWMVYQLQARSLLFFYGLSLTNLDDMWHRAILHPAGNTSQCLTTSMTYSQ